MNLSEKLIRLHEGDIPKYKRVTVREDGRGSHFDNGAAKLGIKKSDLVGWFANKHNAIGWTVFDTTPDEKSDFGKEALRTFSDKFNTTSIAKFDLKKGTMAFLDNKAFEEGTVKFDKATPYSRFVIDDNDKARKKFEV